MGRRKSFSDRPNANLAPVELATRRPDKVEVLPVSAIIADPAIQVRVGGLNEEWVSNFAVIIESGGELEPIVVYRIADEYKVADGFHRLAGAIEAGAEEIRCIIHDGTLEDAKEFAESANLEHGLYLTNDDKKNILWRRIERQHDWINQSDRQISAILGVSHVTIGNWIKELSTVKNLTVDRSVTTGADGRTRKTSNIVGNKTARPWTPKRVKTRIAKINQTFNDDELLTALDQLPDTDRDEAFGHLIELYQRLKALLGD